MKARTKFVCMMAAYFVPCAIVLAAQSILVAGHTTSTFVHGDPFQTPHGALIQSKVEWTGSLVGHGVAHIFSSDYRPDLSPPFTQLNVVSEQKLFTTNGNLFFSEVGERHGLNVEVISVISGGTGIYKGATGTLTFTGILGGDFVYSGVINLVD